MTNSAAPGAPRGASFVVPLVGAAIVAAIAAASGVAGLLYAAVYALAVAPGVMLGRRLVGRDHPAGWILGAALGYGLTAAALWVPIALHRGTWWTYAIAWLLESAIVAAIARRIASPPLALPAARPDDVRALALTLLLVPLLMGPPYRNLGATDEHGTRFYRAYFTADFVWHTALTAELGKADSPPRDPYMASEPLHYYWAYFLMPAVVAHEAPGPLHDVQRNLKTNAMLSALLLIGALYWLVRTAVNSAAVAAAAVVLGVLAESAEGAYAVQHFWATGRPMVLLKGENVDALSSWWLGGLRIDDLVRGLWYNPQHTFACTFGLLGLVIAIAGPHRSSRAAAWTAGAALAFSTCFNPFIGAFFCVVYGVSSLVAAAGRPASIRALLDAALAAIPVGVGLVWSLSTGVGGDAEQTVQIGFWETAAHNTTSALLLSTGPLLIPALAGLWPWRGLPGKPAVTATVGVVLSLLLMHLLRLGDDSWVGFRTGQILFLMLPLLLARVLWAASRVTVWPAAVLAALMLVAGLPTTAVDLYNAQDITNLGEGAGFPWTLTISAAQQSVFGWIAAHTSDRTIVQMEPVVRARANWSLIPTFAERRMSAGLPISLVGEEHFRQASSEVQRIFESPDARQAWQAAHARGIEFLYVDAVDRAAYPMGTHKFETAPDLFTLASRFGDVALYRVR